MISLYMATIRAGRASAAISGGVREEGDPLVLRAEHHPWSRPFRINTSSYIKTFSTMQSFH